MFRLYIKLVAFFLFAWFFFAFKQNLYRYLLGFCFIAFIGARFITILLILRRQRLTVRNICVLYYNIIVHSNGFVLEMVYWTLNNWRICMCNFILFYFFFALCVVFIIYLIIIFEKALILVCHVFVLLGIHILWLLYCCMQFEFFNGFMGVR